MQDEYIKIRQRYGQENSEGTPAIPITVRQVRGLGLQHHVALQAHLA
jgi:hypothetical protein